MGGVCPGRTRKSKFRDNNVGFSGNVDRRKTVVAEEVVVAVQGEEGEEEEEEDEHDKEVIHEYPIPNYEMNRRRFQPLFDSGELNYSISRELKASTPMRTGTSKVLFPFFITFVFDFLF